MQRSHGPEACARARASATLAASYTSVAPIARSLVTIDSRNSGWSSTTSAVKRSAVAGATPSIDPAVACKAVTSAPLVPSVVTPASRAPPNALLRRQTPRRQAGTRATACRA